MTPEEQNVFLSKEYAEAVRYMDNAEETLKRAEKQDYGYYRDEKYVRTACGTAYLGVLIALDAWLLMKGAEFTGKKKQKSIDLYEYTIAGLDKKLLTLLKAAYSTLHLAGYYHGNTCISTIKDGFAAAYEIIEKIKPAVFVEAPDTRGGKIKRAWKSFMVSLAVTFKL